MNTTTTTASTNETTTAPGPVVFEVGPSWSARELERLQEQLAARRAAQAEREARAIAAIEGGRWQDAAECDGADPRLFDADSAEYDPRAAGLLCADCPVSAWCRDWIEEPDQKHFRGVAGGVQIVSERPEGATRARRVVRPLVVSPMVLTIDETDVDDTLGRAA